MHDRRRFVRQIGALACAWASGAQAALPRRVTIAVPGPGNLLFLPLTLARKIAADQLEGLEFEIRYVGGGPQAYKDMLERNSDFSAGGLAALALQALNGKPVVAIAPTTRVPAYTLLVRNDLKGKVKTVRDLAGRVVGVKGHVPGGRSTTQLFTEHILSQANLSVDRVNYVSVGQSFDSQQAALASGTVDAIMGDEPFATRLTALKVAYVLADFHDLETTRKQMGGLFLNGCVATRQDMVDKQPELVEKVVKSMNRTLVWIDQHSAQDVVDALAMEDAAERAALLEVLKLRKNIYAPDSRISTSQVASVTRFLRATELTPAAQAFDVGSIMNTRWAGSAP